MTRFERVFGRQKPVIAMVHLGAMPGTPLYDAAGGVEAILRGAEADLAALQAAGVDAVMFGNENDRPYELRVDVASTATMAHVIGRLRDRITVPFGVNVLWDPMATMALAAATGAALIETKVNSGEWRRALESQPALALLSKKVDLQLDLPGNVKSLTTWLSSTAASVVSTWKPPLLIISSSAGCGPCNTPSTPTRAISL